MILRSQRSAIAKKRASIPVPDGQRWCCSCETVKPEVEFFTIGRALSTRTGRQYRNGACKPCSTRLATEWRRKVPEKNRAFTKKCVAKAKQEVFAHYSGSREPYCDCCGEWRMPFLTLDHINNDGAEHRRMLGQAHGKGSGGPAKTYFDLRKRGFPPGFRVLCINCNAARGWSGECPHEEARRAVVTARAWA
mgnify:CR=1 FL=1